MGGSSSDEDNLEPNAAAIGHPGIIAAPDTTNDVPLPEGIDPKNVEDIFLGLTAVPVPADWSEDDEDEVSKVTFSAVMYVGCADLFEFIRESSFKH